jgi:hypothetical protein
MEFSLTTEPSSTRGLRTDVKRRALLEVLNVYGVEEDPVRTLTGEVLLPDERRVRFSFRDQELLVSLLRIVGFEGVCADEARSLVVVPSGARGDFVAWERPGRVKRPLVDAVRTVVDSLLAEP